MDSCQKMLAEKKTEMMPPTSLINRNIDYISSFNYKIVQNMASERNLAANLKKCDMARLIALHDAGAQEELLSLQTVLKKTRAKARRVSYAGSHGYVTTTAEADSASVSPDLDDDDGLYSPVHDEFGDGDEDYEPYSSSRKSDDSLGKKSSRYVKGFSSKQTPRPNCDVASRVPSAGFGAVPSGLSAVSVTAAGPGSPALEAPTAPSAGGPGCLQAGRLGACGVRGAPEDPSRSKKLTITRPSGGGTAQAVKARVSKTGRIIKPRRDGSYVYSKMLSAPPSSYVPFAMGPSPSPNFRQNASTDGDCFGSQTFPGAGLRPPVPTPSAAIPMNCQQSWSMALPDKQPALPSIQKTGRSTQAGVHKQFNSQQATQTAMRTLSYAFPQPDLSDLQASYVSKVSPNSLNFAYQNQMQSVGPTAPSVDFCNPGIMNQQEQSNYQQMTYQSHLFEKQTEGLLLPLSHSSIPNVNSFGIDSALAEIQTDGFNTSLPLAGNYDTSTTYCTVQAVSDNSVQHQVIRPTPVLALPPNNSLNDHSLGTLEFLLNVRSDRLQMPLQLSPYWKPANTNSVNSYSTPISFASSGPGLSQESTHPIIHPYTPGASVLSPYESSAFQAYAKPNNIYQSKTQFGHSHTSSNYNLCQPQFQVDVHPSSSNFESDAGSQSLNQYEISKHWSTGTQSLALGHQLQQQLVDKSSPEQYPTVYSHHTGPVVLESQQGSRVQVPELQKRVYQSHSKQIMPQSLQLQQQQHSWSQESEEQKYLHQKQMVQKKKQLFTLQQQQNKVQLASAFSCEKKQGFHLPSNSFDNHQPQSSVKKEFDKKKFHCPRKHQSFSHQATVKQREFQDNEQGPAIKKPCLELNRNMLQAHGLSQAQAFINKSTLGVGLAKLMPSTQSQFQSGTPQLPFPEFRGQNNQLSQQLIYDYLTSTEQQLTSSNQMQETQSLSSTAEDPLKCLSDSNELEVGQSCIEESSTGVDDVLPVLSNYVLCTKPQGFSNLRGNVVLENMEPIADCHPDPINVQERSTDQSSKTEGSSSYVQLVPVPVEEVQFVDGTDSTPDYVPLRVVETVSETPFSISKSDNGIAIPLSTGIDSTLQKIVKEDEKTKQAIFLCSNSSGELEYMTLRVSQDEARNSNVDSLPGTAPVSPNPADDCENNIEVEIVAKDIDQSCSSTFSSSHPSQASTIPVTTSDSSTDTASCLTDYLSSSAQSTDVCITICDNVIKDTEVCITISDDVIEDSLQCKTSTERNVEANRNSSVESKETWPVLAVGVSSDSFQNKDSTGEPTEVNVEISQESIDLEKHVMCESDSFKELSPDKSESLQKSEDSSDSVWKPSNNLEEQECHPCDPRACFSDINMNVIKPVKNSEVLEEIAELGGHISPIYSAAELDELQDVREISQKSGAQNLDGIESSNYPKKQMLHCGGPLGEFKDSSFPDISMNVLEESTGGCSVVLEEVAENKEHMSSIYSEIELNFGVAQSGISHTRSKSGKTLPSKQIRQPVRCSPRTSGRSGHSFVCLPDAPRSVSPRLESAMQLPAKGRKPCTNVQHGCGQVLPPAQLSSHLLVCEYTYLKCPAMCCNWEGIAKKLSSHVREAHRGTIGTGSDSKHTVSVQEIHQQQHLSFLREASRKLFVICIHSFGNSIYASIQYIASGRADKPISATGVLEVLNIQGNPIAWRGKIRPIQQSLSSVRESGNCLQVMPESLGDATSITFHTNIRMNQPTSSQPHTASISEPCH